MPMLSSFQSYLVAVFILLLIKPSKIANSEKIIT